MASLWWAMELLTEQIIGLRETLGERLGGEMVTS